MVPSPNCSLLAYDDPLRRGRQAQRSSVEPYRFRADDLLAHRAWPANLGENAPWTTPARRDPAPGRPTLAPARLRQHRREPRARANAARSRERAGVEHVFADQKHRMGLFIRTIGLVRARTKIGLANLAYNLRRYVFLETKAAPA